MNHPIFYRIFNSYDFFPLKSAQWWWTEKNSRHNFSLHSPSSFRWYTWPWLMYSTSVWFHIKYRPREFRKGWFEIEISGEFLQFADNKTYKSEFKSYVTLWTQPLWLCLSWGSKILSKMLKVVNRITKDLWFKVRSVYQWIFSS